MTNPTLGTFGVFGLFEQWKHTTAAQLRDIEALGYGAIWGGGSPPADLDWVESVLEATETLKVATGIVNIWASAAGPVAESFHRIDAAHPGRFLTFALVNFDGIDDDGWTDREVKRLEDSFANGARGLKIDKRLGLRYRYKTGKIGRASCRERV